MHVCRGGVAIPKAHSCAARNGNPRHSGQRIENGNPYPARPPSAAPVVAIPFEKDGYTLHKRDVTLKGGRRQTIFFFARAKPKSGTPTDMPAGYAIGVNKRTGLPYLKKS